MPLITQAARVVEMVARYGSIRRAAERVNSAPSAVNRQILNLEAEFGTPLFERLPRGMRLTDAGRLVVEQVRQWQRDNQRALAHLADLTGRGQAYVRVGTMECLAADFLAGAFGALRQRHPGVALRAVVGGTGDVAGRLMAGEIDLAVTFNAPRDIGLKVIHERRMELGAVMRPDHPLAKKPEVQLDALFDHPLVLADHTLTIGPVVDDMLERSRRPGARAVVTNSVTTLKTMIGEGVGVSVLTFADVFREVRTGQLRFVPLAGQRMFEVLSVAVRDTKALGALTREFARILVAALDEVEKQRR